MRWTCRQRLTPGNKRRLTAMRSPYRPMPQRTPAHLARTGSARTTTWAWATAGALCGALLTLLLCMPATWLAYGLASASHGQIQLQQARGSLWNGSAALVLTGGRDSRDSMRLPSRLQWALRPTLTGARLALHTDCCTEQAIQLQVHARWQGWQLSVADVTSHWPAALLTGLGTPWNTLELQGQLRLSSQSLTLRWLAGRLHSEGRMQLDALAVSSRLSPLRPLGSYRIDITGGDQAQLQLSTLSGDLQLSGQGQWVGQRLRFRGEATASPERESALSNLLNILGRRQGPRSLISLG